jgi:hypothetical protein
MSYSMEAEITNPKVYLQKTADEYIRGIPHSVWSDVLKIMHDKFASKGHLTVTLFPH